MNQPILQVDGLVKCYATATKNAIDGVGFSVESGELFCLLGVNGAGKSSTINIICTLLGKTSGEVSVAGFRLGKQDNQIRQSIGVVFQGNVLDDVLTVSENILSRARLYGFSWHVATTRLQQLAEKLSMTQFLHQRYGKLSGGQRRKCDIARALMARPKILFLDEPTTGLDPQSRIELWETIETIRKTEQMTVFLTTHYMEETEHADRVAIMDAGRILCMDTPQRLKTVYSSDTLRLVCKTGCEQQIAALLVDKTHQLIADTYHLPIKHGIDAIDLLVQAKPYLDSFEMEKGSMDQVFLTVVGGGLNVE